MSQNIDEKIERHIRIATWGITRELGLPRESLPARVLDILRTLAMDSYIDGTNQKPMNSGWEDEPTPVMEHFLEDAKKHQK
jgi:hypothetical protein